MERTVHRLLAAAGLLSLVTSAPVDAQFGAAVDLASGLGDPGAQAWMRETRLAPTLRLEGSRGFLHTATALLERSGSWQVLQSSWDAGLTSRSYGPFQFALSATARQDSALGSELRVATLTSTMSAGTDRSGVWVGGALQDRSTPAIVLGAWRTMGSANISVSTNRRSAVLRALQLRTRTIPIWDSVWTDSIGWIRYQSSRDFTDTITTSRTREWSDLEARVDWSLGRFAMTAILAGRGRTDSAASRVWGRMSATLALNSRVALVAAGGSLPPVFGQHTAANARYATLGIRLSRSMRRHDPLPVPVRSTATAFRIEQLAASEYRVVVRAPGARTVELSGDFNGWSPISLRETSASMWEAMVPLSPGTYHVSLRVNADRWIAPPGVPSVEDEFNGRVGVVIVR